MAATYQIGYATRDITPPVGTHLAGFAARTEPSEGVYHPLRGTATAIDDGNTTWLIVTAEIISFRDLTDPLRERINALTGVNVANIVLSASHTHCGPATGEIDDVFDSPRNLSYLDALVESLARCAKQAYESRKPATLRYGVGHCDLAMCRRKPDPDHPPRVLRGMLPYPDGPCDHDVPVLAVYSPQGRLRHVLLSYACHPTSRGGLLIGGDYVGFALEYVEQHRPGIVAGFLQGCAGDQKVRPYNRGDESFGQRDIDQTRDGGHELGKAVIDLLERDELQTIDEPIAMTQTIIELTAEPPDEAIVNEHLTSDNKWFKMWAKQLREQIDRGETVDRTVPFEVQTIRFGDQLAACTLPAEMTVEYSLRLKRELGDAFKHVLPLAYTNKQVGYVSAKRQFPEYGYEVWDANLYWFRTGRWQQDTEDRIVQTVRKGLGT